ncbi:MAG: YbaB/EbfC family nucleoid-associated protein [Legionellaceae bacterium]|nr:YbaB/EbfC family nucleoid-associated protein [Legionellaceae bacterium]
MNKLTSFENNIVQDKSSEIEKETQAMLAQFNTLEFTGTSEKKEVTVMMNGNYEVLDIQFDSHQKNNLNTLITEAFNDALQQIEFELESRLDGIDYMFFGEIIEAIEKPGDIQNKFKNNLQNKFKQQPLSDIVD